MSISFGPTTRGTRTHARPPSSFKTSSKPPSPFMDGAAVAAAVPPPSFLLARLLSHPLPSPVPPRSGEEKKKLAFCRGEGYFAKWARASERASLATPRPKRGGPDELMVPKMAEELDYWKERKEGHSFSCGAFLGGFSDSGRGRATRVGSQQKRGFLSLNFPPWLWVSVRAIVIASN